MVKRQPKLKIDKIFDSIVILCYLGIAFISLGQLIVGGDKIFVIPLIGISVYFFLNLRKR